MEGDITRPDTLEQIKSLPDVSTVINCAAHVKHFSSRLGYIRPVTMWKYVEKFINMLQRLGFFSMK